MTPEATLFLRILQRSYSVGAAMLVSHVYDNACSAARQRVGLGLRRARIKLLVVPGPESQISAFPLAATIPGVPSSGMFSIVYCITSSSHPP